MEVFLGNFTPFSLHVLVLGIFSSCISWWIVDLVHRFHDEKELEIHMTSFNLSQICGWTLQVAWRKYWIYSAHRRESNICNNNNKKEPVVDFCLFTIVYFFFSLPLLSCKCSTFSYHENREAGDQNGKPYRAKLNPDWFQRSPWEVRGTQ